MTESEFEDRCSSALYNIAIALREAAMSPFGSAPGRDEETVAVRNAALADARTALVHARDAFNRARTTTDRT